MEGAITTAVSGVDLYCLALVYSNILSKDVAQLRQKGMHADKGDCRNRGLAYVQHLPKIMILTTISADLGFILDYKKEAVAL